MKTENGLLQRTFYQATSATWFYGAVLAAPLAVLLMIHGFAINIPHWDEWDFVPLIANFYQGQVPLRDLLAQHNEHRVLVPRLIMLAMAYPTNHNVVAQMYVGWFIRLLSLALLKRLFDLTLPLPRAWSVPLTIVASWLIFSAAEYENLTWGLASVAWSVTLLCPVAMAWAFAEWPSRWHSVLIALLAAIAMTFTSAGGLALWAVGLLGIVACGWLYKKKTSWIQVVFWCSISIVVFLFYFSDYTWINRTGVAAIWAHPANFGQYVLAYLGSPFSAAGEFERSVLLGALGIVGLVSALFRLIRYHRGTMARGFPSLLLILLVLSTAALAANGRLSQEGLTIPSRYISLPALYWIALFTITVSTFIQDKPVEGTSAEAGVSVLANEAFARVLWVMGTAIPWLMLFVLIYVTTYTSRTGHLRLFGLTISGRWFRVPTYFWIACFALALLYVWMGARSSQSLWCGHGNAKAPSRVVALLATALISALLVGGYVTAYANGYTNLAERSFQQRVSRDYLHYHAVAPDEAFAYLYPGGGSYPLFRGWVSQLEALRLGPFVEDAVDKNPRAYAENDIPLEATVALTQSAEVSQNFVSHCQHLAWFDLLFDTTEQPGTKAIIVRIGDTVSGDLVDEWTLPTVEVRNKVWQRFLFDPLPDSAGRNYRVSMTSADEQAGVVVWRSTTDAYPSGGAYSADVPIDGDLLFRFGCGSLPPGETRLDLGSGFTPAFFRMDARDAGIIRWETFTINGESKDVILAPPPASVDWHVTLPRDKSTTLEAFLALDPQVWDEPSGHGVQFLVQGELEDNVANRLFSRHVDPVHNEKDRQWVPVSVDLSQYAGQAITLRLKTKSDSPDGSPYDWAAWGSPLLRVSE